jgi:hypothetical protein
MFGRRIEFDSLSRNFPVRELITPKQASKPRSYTWRNPIRLDQGNIGSCVGNAWAHEAAAKPYAIPGVTEKEALALYHRAQELDAYSDTPPAEGSSVIAGAKATVERGWLKSYRWAFGLDDLILAVGYKGPAVLGIDWYEGMMDTDKKGYVHATGGIVGGHAILCNRVNVTEKFFGLSNSWGLSWGARDAWGLGGTCRISFADMDALLHAQGEACIPVIRSTS